MSQQSSSDPSKEKTITASRLNSPSEEQSITPQPRSENSSYFAAAGSSSPPYISPYAQITETQTSIPTVPILRSQHISPGPSTSLNPELRGLLLTDSPIQVSMSTYSSSSASGSIYDSPNPQRYRGTIGMMSAPKQISAVSTRSSIAAQTRR